MNRYNLFKLISLLLLLTSFSICDAQIYNDTGPLKYVKVEIPKSSLNNKSLKVYLTANNEIIIFDKIVLIENFEEVLTKSLDSLKTNTISIYGDVKCYYGLVMKVIDYAKQKKIKVILKTKEDNIENSGIYENSLSHNLLKDSLFITRSIHFHFATDSILRDNNLDINSFLVLDSLIDFLLIYKSVFIEIGYHSAKVNPSSSINFSQARAQSIKKYLVGKGIESNRLIAKGYSDTEPILKNAKKTEDILINVRIKFKILK